MRNTDYFIGVHGAGLFLGIFTPNHCPFHEVLPRPNMNGLLLMGSLSGHKIFSDVISSQEKNIDGSSYEFFNESIIFFTMDMVMVCAYFWFTGL